MELVRRKLDFEVIKDNYANKMTETILDRFTDLDKGLPGTNFKHQKIQELASQRREQLAVVLAKRKVEKEAKEFARLERR